MITIYKSYIFILLYKTILFARTKLGVDTLNHSFECNLLKKGRRVIKLGFGPIDHLFHHSLIALLTLTTTPLSPRWKRKQGLQIAFNTPCIHISTTVCLTLTLSLFAPPFFLLFLHSHSFKEKNKKK